MALANILSEMPDLLERTLAEHTPDAQGFCRECRDATGVSASWPCVTRELAEQARSMNGPGHDDAPATGTVAGRRRARDLGSAPGVLDGPLDAESAVAGGGLEGLAGSGRHRTP